MKSAQSALWIGVIAGIFIYRFAHIIKLNVFVVLPLLAFTLAFMMQRYGDASVKYPFK